MVAVHLERRERVAQQVQPPDGHRRVDAPVHLLGIDAGREQLSPRSRDSAATCC